MLIALAAGCKAPEAPSSVGVPPIEEPSDSRPAAETLAELDRSLAASIVLQAKYDNDWTRLEELVGMHSRRARLTGSFDDWGRADEALARAYAIAPPGSGPHLSAARLDFALHRLDAVEPRLLLWEKRILVDDNARAEIARLRGDVALQRGNHAGARAHYEASLLIRKALAPTFGLAQLAWWEGRFDDALKGLDDVDAFIVGRDPQTRAWVDLQRGLIALDRGRWVIAKQHYRDASAHFPGWYLVDEHLAEVAHKLGHVEDAELLWRSVIERTNGAPEFLDALAGSLHDRGETAEAAALTAAADTAWRVVLQQFPEAATGHALDHFLDAGPPEEALALARADAMRRPNGNVRTRLAQALLGAGLAAEAKSEVEAVLATPFRSAELFAVGARAARETGDVARAEGWAGEAKGINPQMEVSIEVRH